MADVSDIEAVLVSLVTQLLYPNGTGNPSAITAPCKIYRGWPAPSSLNTDLAAGTVNVSVFPQDNEIKTTKYAPIWEELSNPEPALTLTVSGDTITVGGTPSSPLNAAALVNGTGYVYAVQPGDTLTLIATGLAALINAGTPATSSGAVITIPAAKQLQARVGVVGTIIRETRRQKRGFMVSLWCPTPALRDLAASVIDPQMALLDWLTLPDGSAARILYERSRIVDTAEKESLYRRDLIYSVEYGTTQTENAAAVTVELFNITGGLDPAAPLIETFAI